MKTDLRHSLYALLDDPDQVVARSVMAEILRQGPEMLSALEEIATRESDHAVKEEGQQDQVGDYRFSFKKAGQHEAEIHHQLEDYQYWFPSDGIGELAADHGAGDVQYGCKGHVGAGLKGGVTKTSGEIKRQKWIDENAHCIDDGGEKEYVDGLGETAIDTQARFHRTASMASASPSSLLFLVTAMA